MSNDNIELKDVIHLYLGCEVECVMDMPDDYGWKSGTRVVLDRDMLWDMGEKVYVKGNIVGYWIDYFKIIIRPLSAITETEAWEAWSFVTDVHYYHVTNPKYAIEHGNLSISTEEWANVVRYLLSKGFDLFNLIENNLAIDKNEKP